MRFLPDTEQAAFARGLRDLLDASDTPGVVRSWAAGDHGPGRALWTRLADAGVFALAVPETRGGLGTHLTELVLACVELGRYAVPGPWVETMATATLLARLDSPATSAWLPEIAAGRALVSLCVPTAGGPYALDADAADVVFVADAGTVRSTRSHGAPQRSADPARRLARPSGGTVRAHGTRALAATSYAVDVAALATAAQALGLGRALLERTVAYTGLRRQFGVPVGSFQAVKHRLADTLVGLEFADPLVHAGALALAAPEPGAGRLVAGAKVAAGEAAYAAASTALRLHGALGYTDEPDLSLWIRKARPLRDAWGAPAACRARVVAEAVPR
ncbi:acyl-CoA dehydrogenase family protein [Streptomyces sp. HSG2]|uniref:acyl-CoA dehydrogenase family protein n=1 Tax=Streptomyces sp. HSG2 TaxID=2797167 RepID=UPI0019079C19|nr:acyl-CoA dehydrogenase family protein [Streptomyces sp. HSG2]